jgi:hypothetical protein
MKTWNNFNSLFFGTLAFGFLVSESSNLLTLPILLTAMFVAAYIQNALFGKKALAFDRLIQKRESIDENPIFFRGSQYEPVSKEKRERRYLDLIINFQKQSSIRVGYFSIGIVAGFLILKNPQTSLNASTFIQIMAVLALIPITSQNHKLMPLILSFVAVTFGVVKSGATPGFFHFIYVFLFFLTLSKFPKVDTNRKVSDVKAIFMLVSVLGCLYCLFNFLVPDSNIVQHKVSGSFFGSSSQNGLISGNSKSGSRQGGPGGSQGTSGSGGRGKGGGSNGGGEGRSANGKSGGNGQSGSENGGGSGREAAGHPSQSNGGSEKQNSSKESNQTQHGENPPSDRSASSGDHGEQGDAEGHGGQGGQENQGDQETQGGQSDQGVPEQAPGETTHFDFQKLMRFLIFAVAGVAIILLLSHLSKLRAKKLVSDKKGLTPEAKQNFIRELRMIEAQKLSTKEKIIKKYHLFLKVMAEAHNPRETGFPPYDYAENLKVKFPSIDKSFSTLTSVFSDTLYGEKNIDGPQFEAYDKAFKNILRHFI